MERLVSAYRNKVERMLHDTHIWTHKEKAQILTALDRDPRDINAPLSFAEFTEALRRIPVAELDPHFAPQQRVLLPSGSPMTP
jgi:hypothetical protein